MAGISSFALLALTDPSLDVAIKLLFMAIALLLNDRISRLGDDQLGLFDVASPRLMLPLLLCLGVSGLFALATPAHP